MATAEIIVAIVVFAMAIACAVISVRHFAEKGFLFNNAYIYASKEKRARMNKKPHYRQSAVVFCLLSAVFLVIGLSVVLQNEKIELLEIPLLISAVIYAVVSSVKIEKTK